MLLYLKFGVLVLFRLSARNLCCFYYCAQIDSLDALNF